MDRSDRSIQQTAGDGATQIGEVHGNVYLGGPAPEAEVQLDFAAYREHQLSQLAIWERQYTRLDIDPAVALAGQDLRPVPDSRLALTEAFIRHERLVVVGGAGSGKTTSMLYLVASVLPGGSLSGSLADFIPVYIELGRFHAEVSKTPLEQLLGLIAETLFLGEACSKPPSLDGARQLLASYRFLLILDGLNEAQAELRASCLTAINDLAKRYPAHRVVLSSRPHGFYPPQDWNVVHLRELDNVQIPEFVERYAPDEASRSILQTVLEAHNPLLRLPLFLRLVISMSGSPLPDLQRRLRSRSGLVAQYVEFLLHRDLSKGSSSSADVLSLDQLHDALDRLAQAFQTSGQVLPLADAREALGNPENARQILDELCKRGLLATDGQNLRFWHQTIQEYFYAGSVVRRWRGSRKQVGRMPGWLRRLAARTEEEEALSFMVAHLRSEESEAALRHGLPVNPALAMSWADDLSLAGGAVPITERFTARVRGFGLAARRYAGFGQARWLIFLTLGFLGIPLTLAIALLFLLPFGLIFPDSDISFSLSFFCGIIIGQLPLLDALRCPPIQKLEAILGAIPEIRDTRLRHALEALAWDISRSKITSRGIRALSQSAVVLAKDADGRILITLLRTSEASYAMIRLIGHLDTPSAVLLLAELLKLNNSMSQAALDALATRAARLHDERQRIMDLLWEVWNNSELDNLIRRHARELLLRAGEHPGGEKLLLRYFLLRSLLALTIVLAIVLAFAGAITLMEVTDILLPLLIFFAALLEISVVVLWDSLRIGTHRIHGHPRFESCSPGLFALGSFFLPFLVIPFYILNRQRIRRDAAPVDWDAIQQAIQAKEPHGESLSITHPPSPRR